MAPEKSFSRWGLILAALGMAVGTGNIWRFPRILAANGGGAFLIPWAIFLFLWSIPLLMTEFALGQSTRKGPAGAFGRLIGKPYNWMGCYVGVCTMAIMFYYSVVAGWCFKYFIAAVDGTLAAGISNAGGNAYWNGFVNSKFEPLVFHFLMIVGGIFIIRKGVVRGIEKANKIMLPALLILLIMASLRAITLPNATTGINYLFNPEWHLLLNHKIWLEALSQSAWSTGAGWGLLLTYATYMRRQEDVVLNSYITGFGNNSASLLASIAIFPAVFALAPLVGIDPVSKLAETGPASTGLTFIWMPQLFAKAPLGSLFMALFFLTLSFAAISSLISMLVLAIRMLIDWGLTREKATVWVGISGFLLGIPSAVNMAFFENQDWVWSIGLIISGFFFTFAVIKFGVTRFRKQIIGAARNDLQVGRWYDFLMRFVIPIEFVALICWWFYRATGWQAEWWHPFKGFTIGTCLFQWGLVIIILIIFNNKIANRTLANSPKNES